MIFYFAVDAERIALAGGLYVNYRKVDNLNYVLVPGEHILPNNCTLIRVGKCNNDGMGLFKYAKPKQFPVFKF